MYSGALRQFRLRLESREPSLAQVEVRTSRNYFTGNLELLAMGLYAAYFPNDKQFVRPLTHRLRGDHHLLPTNTMSVTAMAASVEAISPDKREAVNPLPDIGRSEVCTCGSAPKIPAEQARSNGVEETPAAVTRNPTADVGGRKSLRLLARTPLGKQEHGKSQVVPPLFLFSSFTRPGSGYEMVRGTFEARET